MTNPLNDPKVLRGLNLVAKNLRHKAAQNQPYYNQAAADFVKDILTTLHAPDGPQTLRLAPLECTVKTLRQRWYQGCSFIRDNDDPDNKWAKLMAKTRTELFQSHLQLRIKLPLYTINEPEQLDWREPFQEFLENAKHGDKFSRQDIYISDNEIQWAENLIAPVKELFVFSINKHSLTCIRYDEPEATT